jgi:hypothetical protein
MYDRSSRLILYETRLQAPGKRRLWYHNGLRALMKTWKQLFNFLIVLMTALVSFGGSLSAEDNGIAWLGDYREAIRQARETRKPIFVEFRCEA